MVARIDIWLRYDIIGTNGARRLRFTPKHPDDCFEMEFTYDPVLSLVNKADVWLALGKIPYSLGEIQKIRAYNGGREAEVLTEPKSGEMIIIEDIWSKP